MVRCLNCMELHEEQYTVCPHCGFVAGTPPKEVYHLHPGMLLSDRYTIGTVLGFGGFGITYRAWDKVLDRMVAVKEYYPNGIVNRIPGESEVIIYTGDRANEFEKGKQRFLSEARNMAKFSTHPNIVNVYAFFEANNTAYIVMEFLDGISYKQYVKDNGGKVDPKIAVEVTLSVLDALKEIHKAKIIHRDISPDNIFICQGGTVKLIDFGAARFSAGDEEKTLSIILKPGYAPPEQYRSKSRQGPWTDIYAVGAVLYRSLTGLMPEESVNRMVEDHLPPPHEVDPEIPEYLSVSIMRAMALNQELRFQNVEQFAAAIQQKTRVLTVETELKKRKKFRVAGVAAICAVLLCAGTLCFRLYQSGRQSASLSKAEVEVWIPLRDGEQAEGFEKAIEEYKNTYAASGVTVDVRGIPEDDYRDELVKAEQENRMPDLFNSTYLGTEYRDSYASLEEVYRLLKNSQTYDNYLFLDQYQKLDPELKQIPLSFQAPVIYVNQNMSKENGALTDIKQLGTSYALNPSDQAIYESYFGTDLEMKDYEAFLNKSAAYYLGDTGDYQDVQEKMVGIYRISLLEGDKIEGRFTDLFSVSQDSPKAEKNAAVRLVYYLLSETSQNVYNVQNTHGLPLNKAVYDRYEAINGEFSGLKNCFGQMVFPKRQ